MEQRTDLALEERERFPDDDVELSGVVIQNREISDAKLKISTVEITDDRGAKILGKPKGTYITIEAREYLDHDSHEERVLVHELSDAMKELSDHGLCGVKTLVAGLGNREITADAVGPKVVEKMFVTRHLIHEFGTDFQKYHQLEDVCAIAPGVMAQTGMESFEILSGLIKETGVQQVILIDALAARSTQRLNTTIQLTDTGICPGAGIGNHRKALNEETLGVKILAIGVPTVVDAATIVIDTMDEILSGQGFDEEELDRLHQEIHQESTKNMFVTPKNIDESIERISTILAEALNECFSQGLMV